MTSKCLLTLSSMLLAMPLAHCQDELATPSDSKSFATLFANCRRFTPEFDECVMNGINNARAYFPTGVEEYNIPPLDPWVADELEQTGSDYQLKLRNVKQSNWQKSLVYKFKSNLKPGGYIQYSQFFPKLIIEGDYEVMGKAVQGVTKGNWNLTLFDFHQTVVITRSKTNPEALKVKHSFQQIGDAKVHISSLAERNTTASTFDNLVFNHFWRFGYPLVKGLIEDISDSASSGKMSEVFGNFDWDTLLPS